MADVFAEGWVWWAAALAIGVPLVLVVLTEILGALTRRGSAAAGPVRLLRNWGVPVAALLGLLAFAVQQPGEDVWVKVVGTVLGFVVILLVLGAFNVALFANAEEGSWRERIPSIFVDLARLALIVVGLAFLFQFVWGADVGGLITALGVTSIVIGLALQNAVGGVISGLLLLFEQPFKIGDWLDTGGLTGRVVEVNWRAVHIDTGSGIQIVPNSSLAGASFKNLSRPDGPHHATTTVSFTSDDPPHEVIEVLMEVADALPSLVPGHRASATYLGASRYEVSLPLLGPALAGEAVGLYLAWLWYAARRHGLALDGDATDPIQEPGRLEAALDVVAPTLHLSAEDRAEVLAGSRLERYGTGEVVQAPGVVPSEIRFIVQGRVQLWAPVAGGRIDVTVVDAGDYVGQTALTRERAIVGATALEVTTVLAMPLSTLDSLVRSRPQLARDIGQAIELKRRLANEAIATAGVVRGAIESR